MEFDWLFAAEHNFTYNVNPQHHRSAEPANIDDALLLGAQELSVLPSDVWTECSYTIWRVKLIYPFREFMDSCLQQGRATESVIQTYVAPYTAK